MNNKLLIKLVIRICTDIILVTILQCYNVIVNMMLKLWISLLNLFHRVIVFGKNELRYCAVWPLRLLSCLEWVCRVEYTQDRGTRGTSTGALASTSLCIKQSLSAFLLCSSSGNFRLSSISSCVVFQLFRVGTMFSKQSRFSEESMFNQRSVFVEESMFSWQSMLGEWSEIGLVRTATPTD